MRPAAQYGWLGMNMQCIVEMNCDDGRMLHQMSATDLQRDFVSCAARGASDGSSMAPLLRRQRWRYGAGGDGTPTCVDHIPMKPVRVHYARPWRGAFQPG
ncbi:MAG: hypothetical protein M5R41_03545 [Bacteroidia bacterium]|nr:hypothetical protein [Bacteroidia bacterium]